MLAQEMTPIWHGMGLAPGPATDMYSGQAESYGLLAALTFWNIIYHATTTQPPNYNSMLLRQPQSHNNTNHDAGFYHSTPKQHHS